MCVIHMCMCVRVCLPVNKRADYLQRFFFASASHLIFLLVDLAYKRLKNGNEIAEKLSALYFDSE